MTGLQLLVLQPGVKQQEVEPPSLKELVSDPYIVMAAGEFNVLLDCVLGQTVTLY